MLVFALGLLATACAPAAIPGSTPMIFEAPREVVYAAVVGAMGSLRDAFPPESWMERTVNWQVVRQDPERGFVVAERMYGTPAYIDRYVRLTAYVTPIDAGSTQVVLAGRPEAGDAAEVVVQALVARFGPPR